MIQLKRLFKKILVLALSRYGKHRRKLATPHLWVLMYHRVLPKDDPRFLLEEPGMIVTPETFEMHLIEAKKHFQVMHLSEWLCNLEQGNPLPEKTCVFTFDDGWSDNFEFALPLLEKHQVPATLFAVAEKIDTDFQFWPNIILALLLDGRADILQQHPLLNTVLRHFSLPQKFDSEHAAAWIKQLKQLSDANIFKALEELNWQKSLSFAMKPGLMSWEQLRTMASSDWIEVGSHTCNHKRLTSSLSGTELRHEVCNSFNILKSNLNRNIPLFCFPNGDYNQEALSLVQTHYKGAVTTKKGINNIQSLHQHELLRIGLHDQISNTPSLFEAKLSGHV